MDYEGEHHRLVCRVFNHDIRKAETVALLGWTDIRITAEDGEAVVVRRLTEGRGAAEREATAIHRADSRTGRTFGAMRWRPRARLSRRARSPRRRAFVVKGFFVDVVDGQDLGLMARPLATPVR